MLLQPVVLKRNTRINIEWRIRNLPYPIETYSIKAQNEEKIIIISTSNKKYYKKLEVPELVRLGLPIDQMNIDATHKYNTLIVTVSNDFFNTYKYCLIFDEIDFHNR